MTADSLFAECWRDLPFVRKHMMGKANVREVFLDTLRTWDSAALAECQTPVARERYGDIVLARVERASGDKYGFAIMTILLIAVASAVISWLIHRWLDNTFPKAEFEAMRAGL